MSRKNSSRRASAPTGGICARYSSRFQHSIDDQVLTCREWADRNGAQVPDEMVFEDRAVTGRSSRRHSRRWTRLAVRRILTNTRYRDLCGRETLDVLDERSLCAQTDRLHSKLVGQQPRLGYRIAWSLFQFISQAAGCCCGNRLDSHFSRIFHIKTRARGPPTTSSAGHLRFRLNQEKSNDQSCFHEPS